MIKVDYYISKKDRFLYVKVFDFGNTIKVTNWNNQLMCWSKLKTLKDHNHLKMLLEVNHLIPLNKLTLAIIKAEYD